MSKPKEGRPSLREDLRNNVNIIRVDVGIPIMAMPQQYSKLRSWKSRRLEVMATGSCASLGSQSLELWQFFDAPDKHLI